MVTKPAPASQRGTLEPTLVQDYLFKRVGFTPTAEQKVILDCGARYVLVSGGEQSGKSYAASKWLLGHFWLDLAATEQQGASENELLYWLVAADYERTHAEYDYIAGDLTMLFGEKSVSASKRVDPGLIELNLGEKGRRSNIRIETKSAADPRRLAMRAPNGIIACEASQMDLGTFERLRGRVAPKRGWLFMSGTLEGSLGWYPMVKAAWEYGVGDQKSFELPSWTNTALYPGGRQDSEILRLERESSDAFFVERIAGRPVPPKGVVFGEFRPDIHVRDVDWVVGEPIHLWIDPGYAGAFAVEAVQIINDRVQVFDEVYERGLVTEEICHIIRDKPWFRDVKFGVADIAAQSHQAMPAVSEIFIKPPPTGIGLYLSGSKVRINEGTERLKSFLKPDPINGQPKIVFSPRCKGILSEFGAAPDPFDGLTHPYCWKTDKGGNIVGDTPEDKYNHGLKAIIYGLVERWGYGHIRGHDRIRVKRW